MTDTGWRFLRRDGDKESQSDPSQDAFDNLDIDTFVREAVQNSNDAIQDLTGSGKVLLQAEEVDIEQADDELDGFLGAMDYGTLETHINDQTTKNTIGARTMSFAESLKGMGRLRLVKVEDRSAIGLTGEERPLPEEESRYADLVRNLRWSTKGDSGSAGSHGMGKAVYWAFSGFSSVFFNSVLPSEKELREYDVSENPLVDFESPRLVGRAKLSSHSNDEDEDYKDSGYFGKKRTDSETGNWVSSLRGDEAESAAKSLKMSRASGVPGTTVMIPGFRHPSDSSLESVREIHDKFREAAAANFWPAIIRGDLTVKVGKDEEEVEIDESPELEPFAEILQAYTEDNYDDEFSDPGSVVRREVRVKMADKRGDEETADEATVTLLVRKPERNESDDMEGKLAKFRGPGMIVDYDKKSGIPGADPFHAVLIAGTSRKGSKKSDEDLDEFLKNAEPIDHQSWIATKDLKNKYENSIGSTTGYNKTLDDIEEEVEKKLTKIVRPETNADSDVPEELANRFRIPTSSFGPGGEGPARTSLVSLRNVTKSVRDDRWKIEGEVALNTDEFGSLPTWRAVVGISKIGEDKTYDKVGIEKCTAVQIGSTGEPNDAGNAQIEVDQGVDSVEFIVRTEKVEGPQGKLKLKVNGKSTAGEN